MTTNNTACYASAELDDRLEKYLEKNNIDPMDERSDLPMGMSNQDLVPIRGTVHISTGRIVSREEVDRKFKELALAD